MILKKQKNTFILFKCISYSNNIHSRFYLYMYYILWIYIRDRFITSYNQMYLKHLYKCNLYSNEL